MTSRVDERCVPSVKKAFCYNPPMFSAPRVSIVIPIYNEEGNVLPLLASIQSACSALDYEIIAVNDGSNDGTAAELGRASANDSRLRILSFTRNFGQTAALAAGFDNARGGVIVAMDGDGQNDPDDVPRLLAKMDEGYDVVSGWRKDREDRFLSRRLPSLFANRLISLATGTRLHDYGCTLKAYRRSILAGLQIHGEMHRFLPAWCAWQGGRIAELPVRHHARVRGKSKYGIMRTGKVLIDLFTVKFFSGFFWKPNYLFSGAGLLMLVLSGLSAGVAIMDKFGPDRFPKLRIPLLLLAVGFGLVAVFLFLMGLLAELLVRLYLQVGNQKPYRLANEAR